MENCKGNSQHWTRGPNQYTCTPENVGRLVKKAESLRTSEDSAFVNLKFTMRCYTKFPIYISIHLEYSQWSYGLSQQSHASWMHALFHNAMTHFKQKITLVKSLYKSWYCLLAILHLLYNCRFEHGQKGMIFTTSNTLLFKILLGPLGRQAQFKQRDNMHNLSSQLRIQESLLLHYT